MKRILLLTVAIAIAGCDSGISISGISGDFGGKECMYQKMSFKRDGTVYISVMGIEQPGQYKLDGDRVVITADGKGIVFTKKGDVLEAGGGIMHMKCVKM
jgi:hypothetical protein